ncbi:Isochorismate synthase of siderophore biosynthesis [Vibrio cholerae]|nr:Isochorismate synthase of siderophore biosynthesis [Vibrio cholerae]
MVMKREVVGYTTMSEHLIDTQLTRSPFFFASANQSMLGCGVAHAFQQAIPFAELAN